MTTTFEFGLDTFLPVTVDESGQPIGADQVIRNWTPQATWSSPRSQAGPSASDLARP